MEENKKIKYLKLPFQFNEVMLLKELNSIIESYWIPHFNKDGYSGNWNSIALFANNGNAKNIFALNEGKSIIETTAIENCPYLKEVIRQFQCNLLSARLLKLGVGSHIKPHRDYKLGYEDNNFRLHIPITTNPKVSFILDGDLLKMLPGECWYTNVNYIHSVSNKGKSDRVHLVIDCERNSWSDNLFFSLAPEQNFFPDKTEKYSPETLKRMIDELNRSDLPVAKKLIVKLQTELELLNNN